MDTTPITPLDVLRTAVGENGLVDVGKGAELAFGISRMQFINFLSILRNEDYDVSVIVVGQKDNPDIRTTVKVLHKKDLTYKNVVDRQDEIKQLTREG